VKWAVPLFDNWEEQAGEISESGFH